MPLCLSSRKDVRLDLLRQPQVGLLGIFPGSVFLADLRETCLLLSRLDGARLEQNVTLIFIILIRCCGGVMNGHRSVCLQVHDRLPAVILFYVDVFARIAASSSLI